MEKKNFEQILDDEMKYWDEWQDNYGEHRRIVIEEDPNQRNKVWYCKIFGRDDTIFKGAEFIVQINFSENYPIDKPIL